MADAIAGSIPCKRCGHKMAMRVSTINAMAEAKESRGAFAPDLDAALVFRRSTDDLAACSKQVLEG
jgi:hypothetical protein